MFTIQSILCLCVLLLQRRIQKRSRASKMRYSPQKVNRYLLLLNLKKKKSKEAKSQTLDLVCETLAYSLGPLPGYLYCFIAS